MRSHVYQFGLRDALLTLLPPLGGVLLVASILQAGLVFGLLPSPRPALDADRTVMIHQIEAARRQQEAEVVLVGDSSCLMDVMADQLTEELGVPALNLGTSSFLDLESYGRLLTEFRRANPGRPRAVVLLMHPEALRRAGGEPYWLAVFDHALRGADHCPSGQFLAQMLCHLGLDPFRSRVLSRVVPVALPQTNEFGRAYRFTADLERQMARRRGSLEEPAVRRFTGNAEYRLASALRPQASTFRQALPAGTVLLVGITPVPAGFPGADYEQTHASMLAEWSAMLGARPLRLPAVMAADQFGRVTHLNGRGAAVYTRILAGELRSILPGLASR
ncbi:MAG TPA: hypothetical protein VNO52_00025 [Methylomirabilota bacterium]|nr:hypothetical protein [Methylomirabilota bacterium]